MGGARDTNEKTPEAILTAVSTWRLYPRSAGAAQASNIRAMQQCIVPASNEQGPAYSSGVGRRGSQSENAWRLGKHKLTPKAATRPVGASSLPNMPASPYSLLSATSRQPRSLLIQEPLEISEFSLSLNTLGNTVRTQYCNIGVGYAGVRTNTPARYAPAVL